MTVRLRELREQVLAYALQMFRSGLAPATWGNVSARDEETGLVAITPSGMDYETLKPEDICLVDLDGTRVECPHKPSTETPLHLVFYRSRPEVRAVVHTHSTFATAFACQEKEIPMILTTLASTVGGAVPVAPYTPSGTEEFGRVALEAMGDKTAVLLGNHGVVAVGPALPDAYTVAVIVEEAAKITAYGHLLGEPKELPPAEIERMRKKYLTVYGQKG